MRRILIIDDEESIRMLIEATLEGPDFKVLHATGGREGLRLARAVLPDLIILDWMMPGLSGIEVLKQLRGDASTTAIPVMLVTAMCQERNREEAIAAGADAYLFKPFSPLELLRTIRGVLLERELRQRERDDELTHALKG